MKKSLYIGQFSLGAIGVLGHSLIVALLIHEKSSMLFWAFFAFMFYQTWKVWFETLHSIINLKEKK